MRFFPKEENYFDLFEELANKIEEGGQFFLEKTQNHDYSAARVSRLKEIEHEADNIAHRTYKSMHQNFLMPLDHEDIYALVNKMDAILDAIEATAIRIHIYQIKRQNDEISKQAEILFQAIKKIKSVVYGLRNMKNSQMIVDGIVEIHTLENAGDVVLRNIISDLFIKEKDAIELLKLKEIFERLETAIDMCESVSNIVGGIILKHA